MTRLKINGFHTSGGANATDGLGTFIKRCHDSGAPVTVKCVNGTAGFWDVLPLMGQGVEHNIIFRNAKGPHGDDVPDYNADPVDEARLFAIYTINRFPPELIPHKDKIWVELINEVDKAHNEWLAEFCFYLAEFMTDQGFRVLVPGWSAGEPEPDHWEAWADLFVEAEDWPIGIAVHEYAYADQMSFNQQDKIGRYRDILNTCDRHGIAQPPIFITEFGWHYNDAPPTSVGIPQLIDIGQHYAQDPAVKGAVLWCLDKHPNWSDLPDIMNGYMEPLATAIENVRYDAVEPTPPPATGAPKIVIFKVPQEATRARYDDICDTAYGEYKRTVTFSHDDALTMLRAGNNESYAVVFDPNEPSQKQMIDLLEAEGFSYETRGGEFVATHWPTKDRTITQMFGANPEWYKPYGLPGHEGIDIRCPLGDPYFAIADGEVIKVSNKRSDGSESLYGWHVIVDHGNGVTSLYAHAKSHVPVSVGHRVKGGETVAYSGNTGNSSGPHLHLTLKIEGKQTGTYPAGLVDPYPYLEPVRPPATTPPSSGIDLLPYIKGNGRAYRVKHADGRESIFYTWDKGNGEFWQVKDEEAEQFKVFGGWIRRGWDTSAGNGESYVQYQMPYDTAQWVPQAWGIGQTVSVTKYVRHYTPDCAISVDEEVVDGMTFVWHKDSVTFSTGYTVKDCVRIDWNRGESSIYARGYGLVAWGRTHYDPGSPEWSHIKEDVPQYHYPRPEAAGCVNLGSSIVAGIAW